MAFEEEPTYLLVDGENIDATLGLSVLGRRPNPEERPRWDRVFEFAASLWGGDGTPSPEDNDNAYHTSAGGTRGLFFLNATNGQMPMNFVQALMAMHYRPIPLAGSGSMYEKVVDLGIQRTMEAILEQGYGNVLLGSHDGDYIPQVEQLLDAGRRVGVLAFREFVNVELADLQEDGLEIYDLEDAVGAFNSVLPRVRIIDLSEFDPRKYL